MIEFRPRKSFDGAKLEVHETDTPGIVGRVAIGFVERWGMVAAIPEGEDSAGRSVLRLLTPRELVTRALDTSALLITELQRLGYIVQAPSLAEMEEAVREKEEA